MAGNPRRRALYAALALNPIGTTAAVVAIDMWIGARCKGRIHALEDAPQADVALVPGAICSKDGQPLSALEDRLITAVSLLNQRTVSAILVSGDDGGRRQDEVGPMCRFLAAQGVSERDILTDSGSYKTWDTMRRVAGMDVGRVLVCTQRNHLPRALFLADHAGLQATGVIADRRAYRHATYDRVYEAAGRTLAMVDVHVLKRSPPPDSTKV